MTRNSSFSVATTPSIKSIDDIKYKLLHPALTSHYECNFSFPSNSDFDKLLSYNNITNKTDSLSTLLLLCCEATLPGSQLATLDLNNDYTGVTQRHAYRRIYDDRADFTFYVSIDYSPIKIFEAWMRFISGEQIENSEALNNHYRIRYPVDYKTTISISKFDRSLKSKRNSGRSAKKPLDEVTIVYNFYNAFPLSIQSMPVSYETSQLLKCTVSFTYDRYVQDSKIIPGVYSNYTNTDQPLNPSATFTPELQSDINRNAFTQNFDFGADISNITRNVSPAQFASGFNSQNTNVSQFFGTGANLI